MKAILEMPFALDGLAVQELNDFNSRIVGGSGRVKDPCRTMISA